MCFVCALCVCVCALCVCLVCVLCVCALCVPCVWLACLFVRVFVCSFACARPVDCWVTVYLLVCAWAMQDFEQVSTVPLLLSEVEKVLAARRQLEQAGDQDAQMDSDFLKTLDYAQRFGNARTYEADQALRG